MNIDELARRLVAQEVYYCVSGLVSELMNRAFEPGAIMTEDDAIMLARRAPDADDYADADEAGISVVRHDGGWRWHNDDSPDGGQNGDYGDAVEAWRAAFDATGQAEPEGAEALEHWLITDWIADKLEAHGESVARDVAGLTIWARCTSGQLIEMDGVIQAIARDLDGVTS